jgi:Na+/phosphate symporter
MRLGEGGNCLLNIFMWFVYFFFAIALLGLAMLSKKDLESSNVKNHLLSTFLFVFFVGCFVAIIIQASIRCISGLKKIVDSHKIRPDDAEEPTDAN